MARMGATDRTELAERTVNVCSADFAEGFEEASREQFGDMRRAGGGRFAAGKFRRGAVCESGYNSGFAGVSNSAPVSLPVR